MSEQLVKSYESIESVKNKFLKKMDGISDDAFNKKALDGKWSLAQTFYHLHLVESGTIYTIQKNLKADKVKLNAGFDNIFRSIFLGLVLKSPFKFKAPKLVSDLPERISLQEIKDLFEKNNQNFKSILNDLPKELESKQIFKHPLVGLFTINQTLDFVREHYLHHERQLDKLL